VQCNDTSASEGVIVVLAWFYTTLVGLCSGTYWYGQALLATTLQDGLQWSGLLSPTMSSDSQLLGAGLLLAAGPEIFQCENE